MSFFSCLNKFERIFKESPEHRSNLLLKLKEDCEKTLCDLIANGGEFDSLRLCGAGSLQFPESERGRATGLRPIR